MTTNSRLERMQGLLACPTCKGALVNDASGLKCQSCTAAYAFRGQAVVFNKPPETTGADASFQQEQMRGQSLLARLHALGKGIVNSEYMPIDHVRQFVDEAGAQEVVVELGSGNRRLSEGIINVELFCFANVDMVADIARLPFADGSIDRIVLDTVLEHVPEPAVVVGEIHRVLKPGGMVVCLAPWIFPYHGYPKNYYNFSRDGLAYLFREFSSCEIKMSMGPTSALTNLFSEYMALGLSGRSRFMYTLFKGLALLPVFYLKFLDRLWYGSDKALRISSVLCALARK